MRKGNLSSNYLGKIINLFNAQHWDISEEGDASLFSRYCERIEYLKENDKKDLMLELTERYLWVQDNTYIGHLIGALEKFVLHERNIINGRGICVLPLIAPDDYGKSKSSVSVAYDFNNVILRYNNNLSSYKFEVLENINGIVQKIDNDDNILILVDDFIGTGETAQKCINNISRITKSIEKIFVIALVAQKSGIQLIESLGIRVYADVICNKGISDYYQGKELEDKISLMKDIESKLSIKKEYRFGYGASEALVTMKRTPNNTFPLFWKENSCQSKAPFPRF